MTTKKHEVPQELLASLLADYKKPEDLIGENGLLKQLTKLLVEKALDAELTEHLGHERHEAVANAGGDTRNGKSCFIFTFVSQVHRHMQTSRHSWTCSAKP